MVFFFKLLHYGAKALVNYCLQYIQGKKNKDFLLLIIPKGIIDIFFCESE